MARTDRERKREVQCIGNGRYIRANCLPGKLWTYGAAHLRAFWKGLDVKEHIARGFEGGLPVMAQMFRWKCGSGSLRSKRGVRQRVALIDTKSNLYAGEDVYPPQTLA